MRILIFKIQGLLRSPKFLGIAIVTGMICFFLSHSMGRSSLLGLLSSVAGLLLALLTDTSGDLEIFDPRYYWDATSKRLQLWRWSLSWGQEMMILGIFKLLSAPCVLLVLHFVGNRRLYRSSREVALPDSQRKEDSSC